MKHPAAIQSVTCVKAARGSALDLRASLNLLNSLLLPPLAFLLANLDRLLALFKTP